MLSCLLDGRLRIWFGHWLTGLFSAVDSKLLTTAVKQMGAITNISQFSSSCSFWVNTAVIHSRRDRETRNTNATKLNLSTDLCQMRDTCTGLTWTWPNTLHALVSLYGLQSFFPRFQLLINNNHAIPFKLHICSLGSSTICSLRNTNYCGCAGWHTVRQKIDYLVEKYTDWMLLYCLFKWPAHVLVCFSW